MIHFEGDRTFPIPLAEVYAKLGNASFLLSCLPDIEQVVEQSPDRAVWKMKPGVSFVRGTLDITLDIVERIPNEAVTSKVFSRAIGATATVQSHVTFQPHESGTAIHWLADLVETTGLLKMVPKSLISATAGKVIEEGWAEIEKKLK